MNPNLVTSPRATQPETETLDIAEGLLDSS
jgi:hypothetical protein